MIPTHCRRSIRSMYRSDEVALVKDSIEKIATRQNMIQANDRATLSRKLKDNAYKNSEKARMAIPAVNI